MSAEAAPLGPRFDINLPDPVREVRTAPMEPLLVLPIPDRPH